jgi:hypothetical protein
MTTSICSPVLSVSSSTLATPRVYDLASVEEAMDWDLRGFPAVATLIALLALAPSHRDVPAAAVQVAQSQFGDRIRLEPWPSARPIPPYRRPKGPEGESDRLLRLATYVVGDARSRVTGARAAAAAILQCLGADAEGEVWVEQDGTLVVPYSGVGAPDWATEIRVISGRHYVALEPVRRPARGRRVH